LSSRAQPRNLGCHPERSEESRLSSRAQRGISVVIPSAAEGSRFLRRGFDYVREFSPHTLTDGLPLSQKQRRIGRAPGNWGTSRLSPGFPSPGSKLSSRAQPRNLGCHPQRSEGSRFLGRGFDYVREFSPHTLTDGSPRVQEKTNRACPRKLEYVPSVPRFPVPGFKLSSRAQRGISVSSARLRLRQGILTAHRDRRSPTRGKKNE
jgi:hypothetical protein